MQRGGEMEKHQINGASALNSIQMGNSYLSTQQPEGRYPSHHESVVVPGGGGQDKCIPKHGNTWTPSSIFFQYPVINLSTGNFHTGTIYSAINMHSTIGV
jgi:hypothetical protein